MANKSTRGNILEEETVCCNVLKDYDLIVSKINCAIKTIGPYIKTVPRYKPWFFDQNNEKKQMNGAPYKWSLSIL